jgi:hypothetical protein
VINSTRVEVDWSCLRPRMNLTCSAAGSHRIQISDTSLRWTSVSPSMYRWVVWIDR